MLYEGLVAQHDERCIYVTLLQCFYAFTNRGGNAFLPVWISHDFYMLCQWLAIAKFVLNFFSKRAQNTHHMSGLCGSGFSYGTADERLPSYTQELLRLSKSP
jgi:hypothetical protein